MVTALDRCRAGEIAPADVADAAVARSLPRRPACAGWSTPPASSCTPTSGRAPLSDAAVEALAVAAGATDVELDLASGRRGRRGRSALAALAAAVPDAEAVHVVNNGAAALALVTCALAMGREVVVSRGEMVEIGDGFRIPELLESVGARLREVGTTNRVRLADYADAITDETAFVLKVHPSNFEVSGFTSAVDVADLATLPVPVVVDIGSGLLAPHPRLPDEPSAAAALRAGADLVTASGDKLLGGPQCGLMLGRADLVESLRRHPFARALRVDKLTLAALEATLTGPRTAGRRRAGLVAGRAAGAGREGRRLRRRRRARVRRRLDGRRRRWRRPRGRAAECGGGAARRARRAAPSRRDPRGRTGGGRAAAAGPRRRTPG